MLISEDNDITFLEKFLRFDTTNENKYIENIYMCRNFALDLQQNYSLYGNMMVMLCDKGKEHFVNIIEINETLYVIDPQTDNIFTLDKYINKYTIKSIQYSIF